MNEPMSARMTALAARGRAVTYGAKRAVVSRLLRAWDAAPALRLGQLLLAACERAAPPLPLFAVEDERLARIVEAMAVVPDETALTSSQVALARMLDAWQRWPGVSEPLTADDAAMIRFWDLLCSVGLASGSEASEAGDALLARARKAGVL